MVARKLLKLGRGNEEAVTKFLPYNELQEINEEGRPAAADFLHRQTPKPTT